MGDDDGGQNNGDTSSVSYDGYVPTTKDPGNMFLIISVVYCLLMVLLISPLVTLGRKFKKWRKRKKAKARRVNDGTSDATYSEINNDISKSKNEKTKNEPEPAIYSPNPYYNDGDESTEPHATTGLAGSDVSRPRRSRSRSASRSRAGRSRSRSTSRARLERGNDTYRSSDLYEISEHDNMMSTLMGKLHNAIDADDHPRTSKGDVIAHEDEYGTLNAHTIHLPETSCLEVQMRTRTKKANGQNRKYPNKIDPSLLDDEDEEDTTGAFQEYYKEHDEDDDDFNDESETSNSNDDDKEFSALSNMDEIITETTRGINTWNNVIAYNKETRKIMKIAIPCTFSAVSGSLLDAVTTGLIAYNIGSQGYVAYCMVSVFLGLTDTFIGGIEDAEGILTAQAIGMENYFMAGQYYQVSMILYLATSIPCYIMWTFFIDMPILALGLGEEVAALSMDYVKFAVWSYVINGMSDSLSTLLWSADYTTSLTVIDIVCNVLYVINLYYLFEYGYNTLGHVAILGIIWGVIYGVFMFCFVTYHRFLEPYWKGMFRNYAFKNKKLIAGIIKMAVPFSVGDILSYGEWEVLTFIAATMGPAEVAAWCLAGAIWEIFEYLPGGFSDAADIRIAKLLGGGNPRMAKLSAYKCLLYSVVWVSFCTFWLWWYSDYLIYWFTNDETLVNMIYEIVDEISVGVVIMCVGSDAYYIICAQGRTKLATYICLCSSWIISIPLSLFLTVYLNYNLTAVVFAVIISSVTSAVILLYVVLTSNWAKISRKIIRNAEEISDSYQSSKAESSNISTAVELT